MDPIITETVLRSLCASDFTQEDILRGREMVVSGKPERRPVTVYPPLPGKPAPCPLAVCPLDLELALDELSLRSSDGNHRDPPKPYAPFRAKLMDGEVSALAAHTSEGFARTGDPSPAAVA